MATILRDATEDDVDFVAWVMLAASRSHLPVGVWEYLNAQNEAEMLDYLRVLATTDTLHMGHHSLFVIAEVDGAPAAAMCGYDSVTQGYEVFAPQLGVAARACGLDFNDPEFIRRSKVVAEGFVDADAIGPAGPRWIIENVATLPGYQRRGLVKQLLGELFDRGRARGYTTTQISVLLENEPARAAYLKAGFDVVAERRSEGWAREIGSPGTELMLKTL